MDEVLRSSSLLLTACFYYNYILPGLYLVWGPGVFIDLVGPRTGSFVAHVFSKMGIAW
ncbi:hypothetical protein M413DRAFT_443131 [Hebeloma cylindrosporum]|uniref:Uncharacterized protein n=1 Tax=Hebeloma cylindrosporum TaxID=76867 RepID=A0A0C2YSV0_HEBCY|nr:hypothetical protein M413DRAFT_443131 [Hebeloma cylindrosporum h7]